MKRIGFKLWVFTLLLIATEVVAQEKTNEKFTDVKVNLLFGLNQPLLSGFNVEGNLF